MARGYGHQASENAAALRIIYGLPVASSSAI
jgi:hypothetical protein